MIHQGAKQSTILFNGSDHSFAIFMRYHRNQRIHSYSSLYRYCCTAGLCITNRISITTPVINIIDPTKRKNANVAE